MKMHWLLMIVTCMLCIRASLQKTSPCPSVFAYDERDDSNDTWFGTIRLKSNVPLHGVFVDIIFSSPVSGFGTFLQQHYTEDSVVFHVTDKSYQVREGEIVTIKFYVRHAAGRPVPLLQQIRFNGQNICTISAQTSPRRETSYRGQTAPSLTSRETAADVEYSHKEGATGSNGGPHYINDGGDICGTVVPKANPLVTHGSVSENGQFPWHGALYRSLVTQLKYLCGATLISRRASVTAAHCVTLANTNRTVDVDSLLVYFGKIELDKWNGPEQDAKISSIYIPEEYNPQRFYQDIALLLLKDDVKYSSVVRPICLWNYDTDYKGLINKVGLIPGWGYNDRGLVSSRLSYAQMPVVSHETCIWSNRNFFSRVTSDTSFCAGFKNGTSVCNGDSGGGMVFKISNRWYLRGIVSVSAALQDLLRFGKFVNSVAPAHPEIYSKNVTNGQTQRFNSSCQAIRAGVIVSEGRWDAVMHLVADNTIDRAVIEIVFDQPVYMLGQYQCGGSIVGRRWIITAAHCLTRQNTNETLEADLFRVYTGIIDISTIDDHFYRTVDEVIVHREYSPVMYTTDIGLLRLKRNITYNSFIKPVCLYNRTADISAFYGRDGKVTGWGFNRDGVISNVLNYLEVPVVPQKTCSQRNVQFNVVLAVGESFCAGHADGNSVCNGDSGGGLVFAEESRYYLRGIVSISAQRRNLLTCDPNQYSVFTDVSKFLVWIRQQIS
uniref:Peptidase S1 domain-containing protein n=1 Tax=Anopheles atroparvus TaxID=41427 RepID=A0A182JJF3_ANOAO